MKLLVFNENERVIYHSIKKSKKNKVVKFGCEKEWIKNFFPDVVLCYNNLEIVHYCEENNINCLHVYDHLDFKEKNSETICQVFVNLFDINKVKQDKENHSYTFTMLEEASLIISRMLHQFQPGHISLFNPGNITTKEIFEYYRIDTQLQEEETLEVPFNQPHPNMSPIEDFFKEDFTKMINIYVPTYYRFKKCKESLNSIIRCIKNSKFDVMLYVADNMTKDEEMRKWLQEFSEIHEEKCKVYMLQQNEGKANAVNWLHLNSRKCDYIFSIDSDMVHQEKDENFIDRMIFTLTRVQNIGLVSCDHLGQIQHWWGRGVEKIELDSFQVGYSQKGVGIAGCCIVMKTTDWVSVGMYKKDHDIYTGDDGILTNNVRKLLGKECVIDVECKLLHQPPTEDEKGYTEWKAEAWKRDNLQFLDDNFTGSNKKGYWD